MAGRGDPEGVAAFCAEVRPRLVGTLALYCGDAGVAEELAQETLARVWLAWPRVRTLQSPAGWAHHVALNLARSSFRRRAAEHRAARRLEGQAVLAHWDPDGADTVAVREALARLPSRQRAAVVWRYYGGLSSLEAAQVMGCAPATVRALTSQALRRLRTVPGLMDLEEATDAR